MNKHIFIGLVAISFVASAKGQGAIIKGIGDYIIYGSFDNALKKSFPNDPELQKCMLDEFRKYKLADEFYKPGWPTESEKTAEVFDRKIQPYFVTALWKCRAIAFIKTPIGMIVLACLIYLVLFICCCCLKCAK